MERLPKFSRNQKIYGRDKKRELKWSTFTRRSCPSRVGRRRLGRKKIVVSRVKSRIRLRIHGRARKKPIRSMLKGSNRITNPEDSSMDERLLGISGNIPSGNGTAAMQAIPKEKYRMFSLIASNFMLSLVFRSIQSKDATGCEWTGGGVGLPMKLRMTSTASKTREGQFFRRSKS